MPETTCNHPTNWLTLVLLIIATCQFTAGILLGEGMYDLFRNNHYCYWLQQGSRWANSGIYNTLRFFSITKSITVYVTWVILSIATIFLIGTENILNCVFKNRIVTISISITVLEFIINIACIGCTVVYGSIDNLKLDDLDRDCEQRFVVCMIVSCILELISIIIFTFILRLYKKNKLNTINTCCYSKFGLCGDENNTSKSATNVETAARIVSISTENNNKDNYVTNTAIMSDELGQFLKEIQFEEYYHLFKKQGFDTLNALKLLSRDDLIQMGINKIGHQKIILNKINDLDVMANMNDNYDGRGGQVNLGSNVELQTEGGYKTNNIGANSQPQILNTTGKITYQ